MEVFIKYPAITNICSYDKSYQVDVCLNKPLWPTTQQHRPGLQLTVLCGQLELLCEREHRQNQASHPTKSPTSQLFQLKAQQLYDRITALHCKLAPPRPTLTEWLKKTRVAMLYPNAAAYVQDPANYHVIRQHVASSMGEHNTRVAALQQVWSLCQQLQDDANHLSTHKYMAHQLALLYQSVKTLCQDIESPPLCECRDNIARYFKSFKQSLTVAEGCTPRLSEPYTQWLLKVTGEISAIVTSFSTELGHPILKTAAILSDIT